MNTIEAHGRVEIRGPFDVLSKMYDLLGMTLDQSESEKEIVLLLKSEGGFVLIITSPTELVVASKEAT